MKDYKHYYAHKCTNCDFIEFEKVDDCCKNVSTIFVFQYVKGTAKFIREQCVNCGGCENMTRGLSFKTNSNRVREKSVFDQNHYENFKRNRRDEQNDLYQSNKWFKDYNTYLNSDIWKKKRILILERDSYNCQSCLKNKATDVHHLTYKNIGFENLEELVALCRECHTKIHKNNR